MLDRRPPSSPGMPSGGTATVPGRPPSALPAVHTSKTGPPPVLSRPFTMPLPLSPVLSPVERAGATDFYVLAATPGIAELLPGTATEVLTYGGSFCGPTIRARTGRRVVLAYTNDLDAGTVLHLHGAHVAAASAGFPTDTVEPGHTRVYSFPNNQPAATLWYHDHADGRGAEHVYRGLSGMYIVEDPAEARLGLPTGRYDIPIALREVRLSTAARLLWTPGDESVGTILVNGAAQPYLAVASRRYRLRLCNAAPGRTLTLRLAPTGPAIRPGPATRPGGATRSSQPARHEQPARRPGRAALLSGAEPPGPFRPAEPFIVIASDLGLLPRPVPTRTVRLTPAERLDVVIDFGRYPLGTRLVLADDHAGELMSFDVTRVAPDSSRVLAALRPVAAAPPRAAATRRIDLTRGGDGTCQITGRPFDPDRADLVVRRGATEIWQVRNATTAPTTFHPYLVPFTVLSRNGAPPPPAESGSKDTVLLAPGDTLRLLVTFTEFTGRYAVSCHQSGLPWAATARMDVVA